MNEEEKIVADTISADSVSNINENNDDKNHHNNIDIKEESTSVVNETEKVNESSKTVNTAITIDPSLSKRKRLNSYFKQVFNKHGLFLVPNILCYVRLLLAVLYLVIYLLPIDLVSKEPLSSENFYFNSTFCGLLLLTCGFTDFIDGFIARKFKMQSQLGKILDPFADKILQLVITIGFTVKVYFLRNGWEHYYLFFIMLAIFVLKEALLFASNLVFLTKNVELKGATWYGKVSTFVFYVDMGLLVVFYDVLLNHNLAVVVTFMVSLNIVLITITFILYTVEFAKLMKYMKSVSHK